MIHRFRLSKSRGIPSEKDFNSLPFGRQIEFFSKLNDFKSGSETKRGFLDQKRRSTAKALKEFLDLYSVGEYYFADTTKQDYKSDSLEIFYTIKT